MRSTLFHSRISRYKGVQRVRVWGEGFFLTIWISNISSAFPLFLSLISNFFEEACFISTVPPPSLVLYSCYFLKSRITSWIQSFNNWEVQSPFNTALFNLFNVFFFYFSVILRCSRDNSKIDNNRQIFIEIIVLCSGMHNNFEV